MKLITLDPSTWKITSEIPLLAWPRIPDVTPDGTTIYQTIRRLNGCLVVDLAEKGVVNRISLGESKFAVEGKEAHGLAVTPDGRQLWITTQITDDVTIVGTEDQKVVGRVFVGRDPNWIGFTPDGRLVVVSNTGSNDVIIIDVAQRKVVATTKVGASPKRLAVGVVVVN